MRFQVLGPLAAVHNGRPVTLGGVKQRATLGLLLLRANQVVATSELLAALWGDAAPPTARKILQNAVRGLRVVFADAEPELLTRLPGYVLRVDPGEVDLFEFQRRAEQGRAELAAGVPELAAATLRDALALWRGPVLADLAETGVAWPELATVRNARLDVLEDYLEAELASGRHHAAIGELELMVEAEPLRERLCRQLMIALYRSGRQADALRVYARVRTETVERLGLEPSRELRCLQQAILAHDPSLAPPGQATVRELKVVDGLLEYVRHQALPHLVTVLGPPSAEMIRFGTGLERVVAGSGDTVRLLRFSGRDSRRVRAQILAALRHVTGERALVVAIDDLHRADDTLLEFVEDLAELAGPVPLLVVATAWPELLDRRPGWGGGKRHATTMALHSQVDSTQETRRVPLLVATG